MNRDILLPSTFSATSRSGAITSVAIRAVLAALLGVSWQYGHWGPMLSLTLIPLVVLGGNRRDRYGMALAYYLAGSYVLPGGASVFFGPGHVLEGIFLWLASSALLAAGWAFADRPWKVVAALVVDALPPLGLFDWLSPLASAGVLFPGASWAGLLMLLTGVYLSVWWMTQGLPMDLKWRHVCTGTLAFLAGMALMLNVFTALNPAVVPKGWTGMNLHLGPITGNIMADMNRNQEWIRQTQAKAGHHMVVLLPETLTTWWAGNAEEVRQAVPNGQTWLVGASVPVGRDLLADGIEAVHGSGGVEVGGKGKGAEWRVKGGRDGRLLFISAFPMPVSMWHPWSQSHGYVRADGVDYEASWWEPVRKVDGVRTWASICYDQILPWVWMEGVVQDPQVVLLTNNEWWARGTGIPEIQRATAWAWARLIGAPVVEAENS
ncbi:conjugal transfer protein TraB [Acidithiobacillus ferrooxidans]|uniref:conjugal transfer protein TraB n=1 Tax=Acidithiobacillus ferrooxidans TaxID=920 RepID=UPI00214B59D4|nr:conjugal transfer protein TraB [Acidithiobacillus ferrooxidans]MCR2830792.1 conjugal transfer protein TraB [Acidithiobacillus ferrooxidans]